MSDPLHDQVLALAGAFQAVSLVRQLARSGEAEEPAFTACVESVLRLNAATAAAAFGGPGRLLHGLAVLRRQLGEGGESRDTELTRYWVSLLFLERKLARRPDVLETLRGGIEAVGTGPGIEPAFGEEELEHLALLYQHTLSTIPPRILVSGEPAYLEQNSVATRIRVSLLAAIRALVLWRGLGGNRLRLLLGRHRMVAIAKALLADARDAVA